MNRRTGRSRGQALTEFALILPVFMLMVLAVVEGAYYAFTINSLDRAVQEGGRHAAIVPPPTGTGAATRLEVQNRVRDRAIGQTIAPSSVTVAVNGCTTDACFVARTIGQKVRVSFTYAHTPLVAIVFGTGTTFSISMATEYVVE
jgi:Flp pilus assembly protein TadG